MDDRPIEEIVEEAMANEQVLAEWGITRARKDAGIARIVFFVVTVATVLGAAAYLSLADPQFVSNNTTGYYLVLLLAAVTFALRFFQLRAQRDDILRFIPTLKRNLTGEPDHDVQAQIAAENSFEWKSRPFTIVIRMIALAMIVLVAINTYQGSVDMQRQLVFDGCIAIVIAGFAWDQFMFRAELLAAELRARTEAAARFQTTPQFQEMMRARQAAENDDDDWPEDEEEAGWSDTAEQKTDEQTGL